MKKWVKQFICLAVGMFILTCHSVASPAFSNTREVLQPDGSRIYVRLNGDERAHWYANANNNSVIVQSQSGVWYYAQKDNASRSRTKGSVPSNWNLKAGAVKANEKEPDYAVDSDMYAKMMQEILQEEVVEENRRVMSRALQSNQLSQNAGAFSIRTPENLLVVRISFSDTPLKTTRQDWVDMFFGDSHSVNSYYKENSNDKFYFKPVAVGNNTSGVIDIAVALPNPNDDYYNLRVVQEQVIKQLDTKMNFAQFDTNKNNVIDSNELHIFYIAAGYEKAFGGVETGKSNWAHNAGYLMGATVEGKIDLSTYCLAGEKYAYDGNYESIASIGTLCHELAHDLGAPDLYNTVNSTDESIMQLSLMCNGNWTFDKNVIVNGYNVYGSLPTHFDAYTKIRLNFAQSTTVNSDQTFDLYSGKSAYNIVKIPILNLQDQYFLIENRQKSGFDAGLQTPAGEGVVIWRIDEAVIRNSPMTPNNDVNRHGVDYVESGNNRQDAFFGSSIPLTAAQSWYYQNVSNITNYNKASSQVTAVFAGSGEMIQSKVSLQPAEFNGELTALVVRNQSSAGQLLQLSSAVAPEVSYYTAKASSGKAADIANQIYIQATVSGGSVVSGTGIKNVRPGNNSFEVLLQDKKGNRRSVYINVSMFRKLRLEAVRVYAYNSSTGQWDFIHRSTPYNLNNTTVAYLQLNGGSYRKIRVEREIYGWPNTTMHYSEHSNLAGTNNILYDPITIAHPDDPTNKIFFTEYFQFSAKPDRTAPKVLSASHGLSDLTASITGKADKGSYVFAKANNMLISKYVTANSSGNFKLPITKQKKGTVITITAVDRAGNARSMNRTVSARVSSVRLNISRVTLYMGRSTTLRATVLPSNAGDKRLTWSSSNSTVVSVTSSGKITAKKKLGTARITAKSVDGSKIITCTVTVRKIAVKSVRLSRRSLAVKRGKLYRIAYTVYPRNASIQTVTWVSSNKRVVTINRLGYFKGLKKGRATITVRTTDGRKVYRCNITVR